MRTRLPATATVCNRYNVSDRAAAAITSVVLQDFSVISEVDASHVVDKKILDEDDSDLEETDKDITDLSSDEEIAPCS
ncbi:hypothetical protein AVEN_186168-1 [Araneus ventricosus]|uniref:Uncharacterized protein n=1 Tax=Araneus ventricosus TaxID=182803 RepID=A0A4Y2GGG5_ARAVE|nr:hypothetical protein AVEN_186168-1 [Araneus ventricosus]